MHGWHRTGFAEITMGHRVFAETTLSRCVFAEMN